MSLVFKLCFELSCFVDNFIESEDDTHQNLLNFKPKNIFHHKLDTHSEMFVLIWLSFHPFS